MNAMHVILNQPKRITQKGKIVRPSLTIPGYFDFICCTKIREIMLINAPPTNGIR